MGDLVMALEWASEATDNSYHRELFELAARRLQELEEAQRWIPVSEALPEEDVPVLAISEGAVPYLTTAMRVFVDDGPEWSGMAWAQLCETYQPDLWDKNAYEYDDDYEYTHWRPLPPAPAGEG